MVLAWAGCGFPTGAQDVNRADRLPVILQEMRGVVILWKEGCVCGCARSSTQQARFFQTSQVHQNHLEG